MAKPKINKLIAFPEDLANQVKYIADLRKISFTKMTLKLIRLGINELMREEYSD